eukprot:11166577-Lingulodinium_polyedra.AAC.1
MTRVWCRSRGVGYCSPASMPATAGCGCTCTICVPASCGSARPSARTARRRVTTSDQGAEMGVTARLTRE